jgi:ATP-dependent helicase Lhr and Lhr-like helicase
MKRTFRNVAIIAGLIERTPSGPPQTGRQATFSSDILYDTLRKYDPDHLMLQITREEALRGLIDFSAGSRPCSPASAPGSTCCRLTRVTPLAAPLLLLNGARPRPGGRPRPAYGRSGGSP